MRAVSISGDVVLFDCDGVLVDSDASVARAWTRWAVRYELDADEVNAIVHGRRAADTVARLISADQRAEALADINGYELQDARSVTGVPGALALTRQLPPGAWAIVTSGTTALCRARLRAAGFEIPAVLITADDVGSGKPAPDGFLAAARGLDARPGTAIVFEDSPSGVLAARAAGVATVVGVSPRALETDADVVVRDLEGLTWSDRALHVAASGALRLPPA